MSASHAIIDSVRLAGFDKRGDYGPVGSAIVGFGEERIFAVEGERAD